MCYKDRLIIILIFVFSASPSFSQLSPLTIGTIHPGDSIVIKYNVTINTPLVPLSTTQLSNQGTVAGSNFSNVLTDDPDSGPANDATITLLNAFPLPVSFVSVKAYQQSTGINIEWVTATETDIERYDIEKSTDGRLFSVIGTSAALNNNGNSITRYSYYDNNPVTGNNFYRIKSVDRLTGVTKYTSVVNVFTGAAKNIFTVLPNPVQHQSLNLQLQGADKGSYGIAVYTTGGQKLFVKRFEHAGGSASLSFVLPPLSAGIYLLKIDRPLLSPLSKTILVQ